MPDATCFWIEETDRVSRSLRRYRSAPPDDPQHTCTVSGYGYHNAETPIEEGVSIRMEGGYRTTDPLEWPHDDPRWPAVCACGYAFQPTDEWQLFYETIYRNPETGEEFGLRHAPAGAMFRSWWYEPHWIGPDGMSLSVICPPGGIGNEWNIDGQSRGHPEGGAWQRTGTPPKLTVTPSIQTPRYHGYLTDGVFREC